MAASSTAGQIVYSGNDTVYTAPDDADILLSGTRDSLSLGTMDTLAITGPDNAIVGDDAASISLASYGNMIDVDGATIDVAAPPSSGDAANTIGGSASVDDHGQGGTFVFETAGTYDLTGGNSLVGLTVGPDSGLRADAPGAYLQVGTSEGTYRGTVVSGAMSVRVDTNVDPNNTNVVSQIEEYSGTEGAGSLLYGVGQYADGTSEILSAGSGAFGIYREDAFYDGAFGQGSLDATAYDIVTGISIVRTTEAGLAGTIYSGRTVTFSGEDGSGNYISAVNDYRDGTSSYATPGNGAFGVYENLSYYSGPDRTGDLIQTSTDVFTGSGILSINHFETDGAYGCYNVEATTAGPEAQGAVDRTVLDFFGGTSFTLTPVSGDASHELQVVTSGPDGSGAVQSSSLVAAGTARSLFEAFTGFALPGYDAGTSAATTAKLALPVHSLADFAAASSNVAHAISPSAPTETIAALPPMAATNPSLLAASAPAVHPPARPVS